MVIHHLRQDSQHKNRQEKFESHHFAIQEISYGSNTTQEKRQGISQEHPKSIIIQVILHEGD